jgi:hypothetical protein
MASSAELWTGGDRKWWISHEGENGPKGLDFSGNLPDVFKNIKTEMEAKQINNGGDQADVDYIFEIPLLVARALVGFKHDEVCPHAIGNEFKIMRNENQQRGFFSRIFGRK